MAKTEQEEMIKHIKSRISDREEEKRGSHGSLSCDGEEALRRDKEYLHHLTTPPEVRVRELEARIGVGFGFSMSVLEGLQAQLASAKKEIAGESSETAVQRSSSTARPAVMQGDTRRPRSPLDGSQHSGNQPYFDTNSDHMGQIDPLAPHYDLSGDFPRPVNPRNPGPKMPTNG